MYKPTLLFACFALLLAACTLQLTAAVPTPTIPTALPVEVLETQTSLQPTQTPLILSLPTVPPPTVVAVDGGLLYFWPVSLPPEIKVNTARSASSAGGYKIEFDNIQTGASVVLWAGTEADRFPYCAGQTNPYQFRNVEGCSSHGTGAGTSLEWREKGVHYSIGGMGTSLEVVAQFANGLEALDYQSWQQKFAEAAKPEASGQASAAPARTTIEFASGTTSNTLAYRELAAGNFDEYILSALGGQELTISAAPYAFGDGGEYILMVSGVDGSVLVPEAAQANSWTGVLPATQDYVIRVVNRGNTAQYQLKVGLPWRIKFAAGAISTTLNGKLMAGNEGNAYLLQARAGQTMTVRTTSANNNACLTIVARMLDGSGIPLVNAASHPTTSWSTTFPTGTEYSQDYSISVSLCPDAPAMDSFYTLSIEVVN
jgi:hypothetical protein